MANKTPVDYYEILQVSPRADREVIERAFRLLAKRYHPDNKQTGDSNRFEILVEAYRTLSDPKRRATYDDHRDTSNTGYPNDILSNALPSGRVEGEGRTHQAILLFLYFVRRRDPMKPGAGTVALEKVLQIPQKEMEFHLWYLKEKGWIQREEAGGVAITASGVDEVIEKNLLLRKEYLLPHFEESYLKELKLRKKG